MIRPATSADAAAIAAIYNHYVLNTVVTFEEEAVPVADMGWRLEEVAAAKLPWLVAVEDGRILGYAYANKWKSRCAYRWHRPAQRGQRRAAREAGLQENRPVPGGRLEI